jgi:hypothetical protein
VIGAPKQSGMIAAVTLLLYLIFQQMLGLVLLTGRTTSSKDVELPVLRHEVAILLWVPRTVSRPLISAFAAGRPRSHGSQAAQQDRSPWPFDSRT